ncbi:hypothetical protein CJF30_00001117 [Rutstroemia sp. NJR-2017a BBW]|nr:hypothetical protein CJF30_00001117 [Rutstroemia sp. NJR-2017a BBW]
MPQTGCSLCRHCRPSWEVLQRLDLQI